MTFLEVSGPLAFHHVADEIHPLIMTMWEHMRTYSMYFLRYRPGQHTVPQIRAAQNELHQYAKLAEEHLGDHLQSVLLHRAVVHIPEQAIRFGPTAFKLEEWLERDVRRCKRAITNHSTRAPAKHATNVCLKEVGLEVCKADPAHFHIERHLKKADKEPAVGSQDETDEHGVCLLGRLRKGTLGKAGDDVRCCVP